MKLLFERAKILKDIRTFFADAGFLEVETPLSVVSPGLDVHLDAFEISTTGAPRYLITSPEYQMKRLLSQGHSRIFQIAKCFRRGELGELHNPEFTMCEWYRREASMDDVVRDTEALVESITGGEVRLSGRRVDTRGPYEKLSVCHAFHRYARVPEATVLEWAERDEDRFFRVLVDEVEPALEREPRAIFLVDYPASQASLARKRPDDPRFAERFELYVAGVELCNGFGELTDPVEQRERLLADQALRRKRDLPVYPVDERFLDALRGLPPSAGNALGVDRLVALACGSRDIRRVISFMDDEI